MELVALAENPIPAAELGSARAGRITLRYALWPARPGAPARSTVVLCQGRGEFIEKYAEVASDLLARGFAVVAFDWRGQGSSSRLLADVAKGHVDRFAAYQQDLEAIRTSVLDPSCPKPWFGLGHSMGGAILLDHASRGASMFERIVLSAPMLAIAGLGSSRSIAALAWLLAWAGFARHAVPDRRAGSVLAGGFEGNVLTSDRRRFGIIVALSRAAPHLLLGEPTWGWLHAAFRTMGRLRRPEVLRRITTPILAIGCGDDRICATRATERAASHLRAGHIVVIPRARHEILMERDDFREQFWVAFDRFIPGSGGAR